MVYQSEIIAGTTVKIISFLRRNIQKSISIRAISKSINVSYNSCHKIIKRLEREGIVIIKPQSGVSYCSLSRSIQGNLLLSYVCVLESASLFEKHTILKRIINDFRDKFPIEMECLILFGSYAKGKERKGSDIDLFCVSTLKKEVEVFGRFLGMKYAKEIHVVVANPFDFKEMLSVKGITVGKEVVESGVVFYGGERFWDIALSVFSSG